VSDQDVGEIAAVVHDYPAAVLLVDTQAGQVVYLNDLARQLAPHAALPLGVEDWSRAAGLQVDSGGTLGASSTPLSRVVAGDPESGRQVSAALRSQATEAREALWAVGVPLQDAPVGLRARSLLVLMPVRFPDAVAGVQAAAEAGRAQRTVLASGLAMAISDPRAPDDPLIWVSRNFEQVTGWTSAEALGRNCRFLQGPDTEPDAVRRLRTGIAAGETVSQVLLNYRHDGSAFYNHVVVSPVFDAEGTLIHRVSVQTDVTGQVLAARQRDAALADAARARTAQAAAEDAGRYARLLLTSSEALTATVSVEQVASTITDVVGAALGAAGGGLLLADAAGSHLEFTSLGRMPAGTDASWSRISWAEDVPLAVAVRTRRALYFADRGELLAAHPGAAAHGAVSQLGASVNLPLVVGRDVVGAVFLFWDDPQEIPPELRAALQALAGYTAQAVQRATLITERRTAAVILQQSMLTRLPEPDHLEIRARYVPAAAGEYVGGDWYDAIVLPDGATTVVIGDVTGHDMVAAGHMGQLRGLLRAFAFDRQEPPGEIVSRLDRALAGLGVEGLATLVVARIEQLEEDAAAGVRRLRWTNAGHPPPVVLRADGTTDVLESDPELLLGLVPGTTRTDHVHLLSTGSTVILYTDGLIEHRGRSLGDGIEDLRRVLSNCGDCTLEELLDRLVVQLVGENPDDDCAILAVRAHAEVPGCGSPEGGRQ
jgi:PAS domain S-box-containing protein